MRFYARIIVFISTCMPLSLVNAAENSPSNPSKAERAAFFADSIYREYVNRSPSLRYLTPYVNDVDEYFNYGFGLLYRFVGDSPLHFNLKTHIQYVRQELVFARLAYTLSGVSTSYYIPDWDLYFISKEDIDTLRGWYEANKAYLTNDIVNRCLFYYEFRYNPAAGDFSRSYSEGIVDEVEEILFEPVSAFRKSHAPEAK